MQDRSEVDALNRRVVAMLEGAPPMSEVPVELVRAAREAGASVFGPFPLSDRATVETLETAQRSIPVRVIRPKTAARGLYIHLHGGGWVLGDTHHQDCRLEQLADATRQVVVSVGYRLAPEFPYPAGVDDCAAAALALIASATSRFGVSDCTIGGESAGAHLALVTLLRLRDRHGFDGFRAANLLYGIYDLRLTPSARRFGPGPQILTTDSMRWFIEQFAGGCDLTDPDVSPLLADLTGVPPAIFTIGTNDPLLDDSVFLHRRWTSAGAESELQVFPGAPHAFDAFELEITRQAHERIHSFLSDRLPA